MWRSQRTWVCYFSIKIRFPWKRVFRTWPQFSFVQRDRSKAMFRLSGFSSWPRICGSRFETKKTSLWEGKGEKLGVSKWYSSRMEHWMIGFPHALPDLWMRVELVRKRKGLCLFPCVKFALENNLFSGHWWNDSDILTVFMTMFIGLIAPPLPLVWNSKMREEKGVNCASGT